MGGRRRGRPGQRAPDCTFIDIVGQRLAKEAPRAIETPRGLCPFNERLDRARDAGGIWRPTLVEVIRPVLEEFGQGGGESRPVLDAVQSQGLKVE